MRQFAVPQNYILDQKLANVRALQQQMDRVEQRVQNAVQASRKGQVDRAGLVRQTARGMQQKLQTQLQALDQQLVCRLSNLSHKVNYAQYKIECLAHNRRVVIEKSQPLIDIQQSLLKTSLLVDSGHFNLVSIQSQNTVLQSMGEMLSLFTSQFEIILGKLAAVDSLLQHTEAATGAFHVLIPMNLGNIAALSSQLLNDMTMFNGLAKLQQIQTKVIRISKNVLGL